MSSALVTGGAGFIGFALAKTLADDPQNEVVIVDNFTRGERDRELAALCERPNVTFCEADLTDPAAVARLPQRSFDVVYHLAALNGTQNFYEDPYRVLRCSTLPTFTLIDAYAARGRVGRFVYAGSSEAYASTVTRFDWPVPTDESVPLSIADPLNARWSYGASKLHGEVTTAHGCRQFGVPFTIIRYHNAYGPRMGDKHVIPDFATRMARGVYELHGHADTRSFLYIDDAVSATIRLAQTPGAAGQVVNVGSDVEITILDLAKRMLALSGIAAEIALHPSPQGSVRRRSPNIGKLRKLIGFEPRWTLDDGLRETMRYYVERAHAS